MALKRLEFTCIVCRCEFTLGNSPKNRSRTNVKCRRCHLISISKLGGQATVEKYGRDHLKKLGQQLQNWHAENPDASRDGIMRGAQALEPHRSAAGRKGGARTRDLGKLKIASKLANSPDSHIRRFETLRRKGKLWSSAPENAFFDFLCEKFGENDVIHHVQIKTFRIDFYIKSLDLYVEFDGVYWHGLDRPYDELTGTPKDKFDRDRRCDEYFATTGLKLCRITDKEFSSKPSEIILAKLCETAGGKQNLDPCAQ